MEKEEERFRHTLKTGLGILDGELDCGEQLSGSTMLLLHDTYGFPLELTEEIAAERSIDVDLEEFEAETKATRRRRLVATELLMRAASIYIAKCSISSGSPSSLATPTMSVSPVSSQHSNR